MSPSTWKTKFYTKTTNYIMAFVNTSDSILIRATLTDEGKKLLARGEFKVSKFALGDDEIDYELFDVDGTLTSDGYEPALENTKIYEASSNRHKNIQFGLTSHDSGILYLTAEELDRNDNHAHVAFLPILKTNNKLSITPTISGTMNYLSINDETTQELNSISNFNFLRTDNYDACKIVVESGIHFPVENDEVNLIALEMYDDPSYGYASAFTRDFYLLQKFLIDNDYYVYCDDRFFRGLVGTHQNSKFENFQGGETIMKFLSIENIAPISLESEFENYATYILSGIPNLMYDLFMIDRETAEVGTSGQTHSVLNGPRGSIVGCNPLINQQMRTNSASTRDFRFTEYGKTDQIVFSELPTKKFDYIDTTIYFVGATSNSRVRVPVRIIRYSGTT